MNVETWAGLGSHLAIGGNRVFTVRTGPRSDHPVVILHGFPTCSYDWWRVLEFFDQHDVILFDMLGYGLSDKPFDHVYSLFEQADIATAVLGKLGVERCTLVSHDMGDSVGGELCARALEDASPFEITARVVLNGSIYMDLVRLSPGQELLLALPDAPLAEDAAITPELFKAGLAATFGARTQPSADELDAQWELLQRDGGNRILPRLIRYVEERREHEARWTAAIERHPAPLTIVWGDADPIAVYGMATRLAGSRRDATLVRLQEIGHYPMIEAPADVADAIAVAIG